PGPMARCGRAVWTALPRTAVPGAGRPSPAGCPGRGGPAGRAAAGAPRHRRPEPAPTPAPSRAHRPRPAAALKSRPVPRGAVNVSVPPVARPPPYPGPPPGATHPLPDPATVGRDSVFTFQSVEERPDEDAALMRRVALGDQTAFA